jgi:tetratricopeptide (TPR) repeat protein
MSGWRILRFGILVGVVVGFGCDPPSATVRAQSLVRQHREEDAVSTLRRRLESHPDDVSARRLLIRILGSMGDMVAAKGEVAELLKILPPGDPSPYLELGHAFELTHGYDEALDAYDQAAAVAPQSPDGPREGGMRCARWGELEQARPRLEEAIRRGAHDAATWHALGLVRLHLGDPDGAAEAYRAGAAADPSSAESWLGLATVGMVRGDAQLALDAYDQVLARSPRFAPAQLGRAWALAKLGRTGEAARALDRAEEMGAPASNIARQRAALTSDLPSSPPTPPRGPLE